MIEMVSGVIGDVAADSVLVGTASGLSFRILCHKRLVEWFAASGDDVALVTALVVSQGEPSLYGFLSQAERRCFDLLQKASGIGPRLAHAILGVFDVDMLADIVSRADLKALSRVPGLGTKKAERLTRELKDRFEALRTEVRESAPRAEDKADIENALVGLGFDGKAVREAVSAVAKENAGIDDAELLRRALRILGTRM